MAKRPIIKVTDLAALKKWAEESNFDGLVRVVTEEREDKKMLRGLVRNALALKQTIPGVEVTFNDGKDKNQTDLEQAIAEKKTSEPKADAEVEVKKDTADEEKPKLKPITKPSFGVKKRA